jgi:hypothetical protein
MPARPLITTGCVPVDVRDLCSLLRTGVYRTGIRTLDTARIAVFQSHKGVPLQYVTAFDTLRPMASVYGKMPVEDAAVRSVDRTDFTRNR